MSWDEDNSRYDTGYYNANIITGTPQGVQNFRNIYHGPAFELLLIAIEKLQLTFWQQTDSSDIYFTKRGYYTWRKILENVFSLKPMDISLVWIECIYRMMPSIHSTESIKWVRARQDLPPLFQLNLFNRE